MFDAVLVANRGEIARRILRTCRRLGITTIAVHSDADVDEPHVTEADRAVRLGPAPPADSYLDVTRIVQAASATGAAAVHPGYGFLAENPRLAEACEEAGIAFVGPRSATIRMMGDKAAAKRQVAAAGVPVIPGPHDDTLDDPALVAAARELGLPVLLKPVAGGGGAGLRVVREATELRAAVDSARREAAAAVGDDRLLVERLLPDARHVEIQVLGDGHGSLIHLGERECSVQRRHQKLIEETPSPAVDEDLRRRMGAAAVAAAKAIDYENAGTVEFLLDASGAFHFLEMNTRLQVEHPVTELVTGLDLVELQLVVAAGGALPVTQDQVRASGHALEVRLYAEDPAAGFLPDTGRVHRVEFPPVPDLRVDSGVEHGSLVSPHYDPLLAKLVVHADDRAGSIRRMRRALEETVVLGVRTNRELLDAVLATSAFADGRLSTSFLAEHLPDWEPSPVPRTLLLAAAVALVEHHTGEGRPDAAAAAPDPWRTLGPWRSTGIGGWRLRLRSGRDEHELVVRRDRRDLRIDLDDDIVSASMRGRGPGGALRVRLDRQELSVRAVVDGRTVWIHTAGLTRRLEVVAPTRHLRPGALRAGAALEAPLPGTVTVVAVDEGDRVTAGTTLLAMEAMKMEHSVTAPVDGRVSAVHVAAGDAVEAGRPLVELEPDPGEPTDQTDEGVDGG